MIIKLNSLLHLIRLFHVLTNGNVQSEITLCIFNLSGQNNLEFERELELTIYDLENIMPSLSEKQYQ